ncbi:MAG TPA: acylneuraminate cytidylyltransferase [Paludibacteraceae bacterium]|nr:acylneuraminate cytidylyltransferase [Paludibacteraceae bacterium]HOL28952.1 acylneuraminate cytidylyltransferase [Paludibacteraceae bacterium]HPQ12759.1 acylneuraminate cytidylyltransferase [Paludibacteraceae bacterium]HQG68139.1 acylneuraminate cytidylyltransferase [Paludibacteraceae bacterium]
MVNQPVEKVQLPQKEKQKIKLLLSDIDGVMTDGGLYYSEFGDQSKKFHVRDGMGLKILQSKGIKVGIVTSEDNKIAEMRYNKLQLDYLYKGRKNGGKLAAALEICEKEGISLQQTAYIGDDVNCYELLCSVGLAACPADAMELIKSVPGIIKMKAKGGQGCVREFVEYILKNYC